VGLHGWLIHSSAVRPYVCITIAETSSSTAYTGSVIGGVG
jgi:hypothetical protein